MSRFLRIILLFLREIPVVDFSYRVSFSSFFFLIARDERVKGKEKCSFLICSINPSLSRSSFRGCPSVSDQSVLLEALHCSEE